MKKLGEIVSEPMRLEEIFHVSKVFSCWKEMLDIMLVQFFILKKIFNEV